MKKYLDYLKKSQETREALQDAFREQSELLNEGWFHNNDTAQKRRLERRREKHMKALDEPSDKYQNWVHKQNNRDTHVLTRFKRRYGVKGHTTFLRDTDYTPSPVKENINEMTFKDFPQLKQKTPEHMKDWPPKPAEKGQVSKHADWSQFPSLQQESMKKDKLSSSDKKVAGKIAAALAPKKQKPKSAFDNVKGSKWYKPEWKSKSWATKGSDPKEIDAHYKEWKQIKDEHGGDVANEWLGKSTIGYGNDHILKNILNRGKKSSAEIASQSAHSKINMTLAAHGFKKYDDEHGKQKYAHPSWGNGHVEVSMKDGKHNVLIRHYSRGRPPAIAKKLKSALTAVNIKEEFDSEGH